MILTTLVAMPRALSPVATATLNARRAYVQRLQRANRWSALAGAPLKVWLDQARARAPLDPQCLTVHPTTDVRPAGTFPLQDAIDQLQAHRVADLLSQGADPNAAVPRSTTTFEASVHRRSPIWALSDAVSPLREALSMAPSRPLNPAYEAWTDAELDAQALIVGLLLAAGATVDDKAVNDALRTPNPGLTALVLGLWGDRAPPSPIRLNAMGVRMASGEWEVFCPKELWRHLLDAGWSMTVPNAGQTALDAALYRGSDTMVHALLDLGAPLGPTALEQGIRRHGQDLTVIRRLIGMGADVNARDKLDLGMSMLHVAAANDQGPAVRALIEAGAPVDAQDFLGRTPLYMAAERGNADCVDVLLAAGADPTVRTMHGPTVHALRGPTLVEVARARLNQPDTDDDDRRVVQVLENLALQAVLETFDETSDGSLLRKERNRL